MNNSSLGYSSYRDFSMVYIKGIKTIPKKTKINFILSLHTWSTALDFRGVRFSESDILWFDDHNVRAIADIFAIPLDMNQVFASFFGDEGYHDSVVGSSLEFDGFLAAGWWDKGSLKVLQIVGQTNSGYLETDVIARLLFAGTDHDFDWTARNMVTATFDVDLFVAWKKKKIIKHWESKSWKMI